MKKNKNIFRSPGYTKPSVQSVTFLRRLSRLPASHPALPGISRCKTRRELKLPRCGNAHISSNTLAYAGAGWLYRSCSAGFISYISNMQDFLFLERFFLNFFYFFCILQNRQVEENFGYGFENHVLQKKESSCGAIHKSFLSLLLHFSVCISYIAWQI